MKRNKTEPAVPAEPAETPRQAAVRHIEEALKLVAGELVQTCGGDTCADTLREMTDAQSHLVEAMHGLGY